MDDLLPIGSVIKTDNPRNLMIIGYYPSKPSDENFFDYICCRTRLGIIAPTSKLTKDKNYFYVNHKEIKDILFLGYQDNNYELYKKVLKELKEKMENAKKNNKVTEEDLNKIYEDVFQKYYKKESE